jgi:hypothetical protein
MKKLFLLLSFVLTFQAFAQTTSEPFAKGNSQGLNWELRLNLPDCDHAGQKPGAFCTYKDMYKAARKSGVEDKLRDWMFDPEVKALFLAYFSFSNKTIRKRLCSASQKRQLPITIYLDDANADELREWFDTKCKGQKTIVVKRLGAPFMSPGGHLQHAKIFMAAGTKNLKEYTKMSTSEKAEARNRTLKFTSSSANMSSGGLSVHFENWLLFEQNETKNLAQSNICAFLAFEDATKEASNPRDIFAKSYNSCQKRIEDSRRRDISVIMVPTKSSYKPLNAMKNVVNSAKKNLRVAIHRLTTAQIYRSIFGKKADSVDFEMIMDDDTLRVGVRDGGLARDVGSNDIKAYRHLRRKGEVTFMETNAETHLFHNKFVIADDKALFQGAGNFTGRALNTYGYGNYEQFYEIRIPEIVKAYIRGFQEMKRRSTKRSNHPVGNHADLDL